MPMKIYHYTTLETLALILKNNTIRFNRLDKVDDLEEGNIASAGVKLGRYAFVSCWTESKEESIPLWKLYTNGCSGVRIGFEFEPFEEYEIKSTNELDVEGGILKKKFSQSELFHSEYFILPNFNRDFFYRKIIYVDDVYKETNQLITNDEHGNGFKIAFNKVGLYKNKRWKFQEETRFVFIAFPKISKIPYYSNDYVKEFGYVLQNNLLPPFEFRDLQLKSSAFDNFEVTLSPLTRPPQEIIVQTLLKEYAPNAILKNSNLVESVKLK